MGCFSCPFGDVMLVSGLQAVFTARIACSKAAPSRPQTARLQCVCLRPQAESVAGVSRAHISTRHVSWHPHHGALQRSCSSLHCFTLLIALHRDHDSSAHCTYPPSILESRVPCPTGRVYSIRDMGEHNDLTVDLGAYRYNPTRMGLITNVIEGLLGLATRIYQVRRCCNSRSRSGNGL